MPRIISADGDEGGFVMCRVGLLEMRARSPRTDPLRCLIVVADGEFLGSGALLFSFEHGNKPELWVLMTSERRKH